MTIRNKLGFIVIALVLVSGFWVYRRLHPTPESVLADFYAGKGRAEDMLMDPLILHADRVAPLVIREVERPDMPHRRYAIGFLGQTGVREALPLLHRILTNSQEQDYFRADALEAVYSIDPSEGRRLASDYTAATNFLGYVAGKIADGSHVSDHRTYWQALTGHHE
jgi:hypothetical protein